MKYVGQFMIIAVFSALGELLHSLIPAPIPASVYGLMLLFAALCLGIVKLPMIKEVSGFLVAVMPVMFVPAAVGLMTSWEIIVDNLAAFLVITFFVTILVMVVSGWVTQLIMRGGKKHE